MTVLREQEIINRNNIVALNEAFKRSEKERQQALERVKSLETTIVMFQKSVTDLKQSVSLLSAKLYTGGSTV